MITSTTNPRIQAARRLRRRSGRDDAGEYLLEGARAVAAALDAGAPVRAVFLDPEGAAADAVEAAAARAGLPVTHVSERVVAALSESPSPQGAVAVMVAPRDCLDSVGEIDLVLVLAGVADPGNAGTLVRSAVAARAGAVVFTKGSVDVTNSKTVRAAAGNLWHVPIVRDADIAEVGAGLKARGFTILGADASAPRGHHEVDLRGPVALVVGNEAWGLPDDARALLDDVVSIRMPGPAESLNAAIAGSLLLFEAVRQRSDG
jgi:TrmH family RNA methyltransferase